MKMGVSGGTWYIQLAVMVMLMVVVIDVAVHGYPYEMIGEGCSNSMTVGSDLMSGTAVSNSSRTVYIQHADGSELPSGGYYQWGETLYVSLLNTGSTDQWVLETTGPAYFAGGSCTGSTRFTNGIGTLLMPTVGTGHTITVTTMTNYLKV